MSQNSSSALQNWRYASQPRVAAAVISGIAVSVIASFGASPVLVSMWGWDAAAAVYIVWLLATVFRLDCHQTARLASAEDPDRFTVDVLMIIAGLGGLIAVAIAFVEPSNAHEGAKTALMTTCVGTVILSWLLVHMTFTLRYDPLFYAIPNGGIDFHNDADPSYLDFAYVSFTVGMTFQVSDTDIIKPRIRHAILRHSLLSYLFGTVILATTINLVAGLSK